MVPIPLPHCNQPPGSSTQSCMQGHYWLPLFHPLLTTPSRGPTPSSKADSRASDPLLLWTCSAPSPDFSSLYALTVRNVSCRLQKKPSWRWFCSSATQPLPSPRESLITCPLFHHGLQPTSLFPPSFQLHRQQYSPTPNCFKQTILPPPVWYPSMDWRICPLPFWSWRRWSVCNMLQMQHIPFLILFLRSNCLQLHSWNLCPQARSCLVY